MEYKVFDLNEQVMVKLNDEGYKRLCDYWHEMDASVGRNLFPDITIDYLKAKADSDGYTSFQFWQFMNAFGAYIRMGIDPMFETKVLIKDSDLKEVPPPTAKTKL